jgi:hypothetical protein
MSTFEDIQKTWQASGSDAGLPSAVEVMKDIKRKHRTTLLKTIGATVMLAITCIFITFLAFQFQFKYPTTKVGMIIIIIAVAGGVFANARLSIMHWGNARLIDDTASYLQAMISYRQKQRFYSTRFISWYFLLMSLGFILYLYEFMARDIKFGIISYTLTFGWFAIAWFFLRTRAIKKNEARMADTISKLERLLRQMKEEDKPDLM